MASLSMSRIPGPQDAHVEQYTTLDGQLLTIRYDWIQRLLRWTMSLYRSDGTPVAEGISLVCNADLLQPYRWNPDCPQGFLFVKDTTGAGRDPAWDAFRTGDFEIYYFEEIP